MTRRVNDLLLILRIVTDMFIVNLAWLIAYSLRFSGLFPVPKGIPDSYLYLKLLPFVSVIWLAVFASSGLYRRTGRHRSAFVEGLDIIQSCILATLAFIAFTYLYEEYRYSRGVVLLYAFLHTALLIAGRSGIRKLLRLYRRRSVPRRNIIIGGGANLRHAIELNQFGELTTTAISGVMLVGDAKQIAAGQQLADQESIATYDVPRDWPSFFAAVPTETVVLALPHGAYSFLEQHLDAIAGQIGDIRLIPDLLKYTRFAAGIDIVAGTPVVTINESPLAGLGSVIKRFLDLTLTTFGILILSPLLAILAVIVKATSPGPILYRQERMGLDGRTFTILKFRSMPIDAEERTGAVWATQEDQRPTALGRLMRRTNLDELPQLFNVFKGDMSLVGPRPERPIFVNQFRRKVPGYYLRHKAKAGLTGWAQVNGWRGNTSIEKRIECDLYYIQNWSVWFDIKIIFLTLCKSFIDKNAY